MSASMWIAKTGTVIFFAIIVQAQLSGRAAADDRGELGELTTRQFDLTYCQGWTERRDSNGTGLAVSGGSRSRAE